MFHCFGCDAAGDAIAFLQRIENLDFPTALRRTAEFAGVAPVPSVTNARPVSPAKTNGSATAELKPEPARIVETYRYTDEQGELLYEVLRLQPKSFRQRRPDGNGDWTWSLGDVRRVLYRLPQVIAAKAIYVVEGEKDVQSLEAVGIFATTNSGGANQPWLPAYTQALTGKTAIVIPDSDKPGRERGRRIVKELTGIASEVLLVELPAETKDITDFFDAGNGVDDLSELVEAARRRKRVDELTNRGLLTAIEIVETVDGGFRAVMTPPRGLQSGFIELDRLTHGFSPGELVIAAGRPSMGKTAWAHGVAQNLAGQGKTIAIFSDEMSRQAVLLLRASFRPASRICALRALLRHRQNLVRYGAAHVQHIQKALDQMNLPLHHVLSDISGVTGLRILDSILAGERDPAKLAKLRDPRVRSSEGTIAKALTGNYRSEHLFTLRQALKMYRHYQRMIAGCDQQIEGLLEALPRKGRSGRATLASAAAQSPPSAASSWGR